MRVSNLNHETAVRSLFIAHEIEPETWGRVTKRLNGTNTAAVLKDDMLKCPKKIPFMFDSWREYRDYLCKTLITDPKKQSAFMKRFDKMDGQYADMLRKDDMYRVHIKSLLANDYEFVMTDNWERSPTINSLRNFWKGRYHSNNASNPYIDWSKFNADGSRIESIS
jgi:predicted phosphoadenosine phosphosulfate sulfurtransferase